MFLISQFTAFSQRFYCICSPTIRIQYIYLVATWCVYIAKIESVQRRFIKRIPYVSHLSYSERLEFLGLESLEYRRIIANLNMMYLIVHNLVDVALITFNSTYVAKNSLLKFYKQTSVSSVRAQFMCVRYISMHGIIYQKRQDLLL